jgi:ribonuclease P protein subunit RPR2|tara:strand:- start:1438 stop:1734 length:297 start_codon:yes stop_codon:yes gene_type:complete
MNNKEIARERIKKLFEEADSVFSKDKKLANRYIRLARKIAMKFNLRMPRGYKRKFCKHCYSYLKPGVNLRVRTKDGKVIYYCLECKKFMRFPVSKKGK